MEHKYLDKVKSLEGPPKKVNIFSKKGGTADPQLLLLIRKN